MYKNKGNGQKKKKPKLQILSANPLTKQEYVHSPTVPGMSDKVERVIDSIEYMRTKYPLEYAVANRLRRAHGVIYGSIGGVGDLERPRGGGQPGAPPIQFFDAARTLTEMGKLVTGGWRVLIDLVVLEGYTIEQAGNIMAGPDILSKRDRERLARGLRDVLRLLAEHWGWEPDQQPSKIRAFTSPCLAEVPATVVRGHVVHATGHRVFKLG